MEIAAILTYDSGNVYAVRGWASGAKKTVGPFEKPAKVSRLGSNGWHRLELFNSAGGSGKYNLKNREELIEAARDRIETTYDPGAELEHTRTYPFSL